MFVRQEWRDYFSPVPGVKLLESAPDPAATAPVVLDARFAEEVIGSRPSYPLVVVMERHDLERECYWLARGADACLFVADDLQAEVHACIERTRARQTALRRVRKGDLGYRAMVENLLDVVTLIDGFGIIKYESPSIAEVFGYDPEELVGRNSMEFVHPGDAPQLLKLIAEGRDVPSLRATARYRFRHRVDGWRFVESKAVNLIHDPAVQSIVVVTRDVTDRQVAEDSLRASRGRLEALLDAIPDAYVLMDADGIYREVHIPASYPTRHRRDDLIGSHIRDVLPEDLAQKALHSIHEVLSTGKPAEFDYSLSVGDEVRFREARVVPFEDGLALSVQRDITERVKSVEALRVSEFRFRSLFEASPDAIFVESSDGRVLDANPAACRLHKADRDWLLGRHISDLVPPAHREGVERAFRRLVDGEIQHGSGFSLTREGESVPVEFSVGRTVFGSQPALLLHVRDVTMQRRQETMIRTLASYQQTLIEKERARISREVHDVLGQALTGLRFDISRLGRALAGTYQERIAETTGSIDALIDDVRRIASELRPSILDDLGITAAVEWQSRRVAERLGLELDLALEGTIEVDPDQSIALFRILQELLTNVGRHADAGRVRVELGVRDGAIVLSVADDGTGLEAEPDQRQSLGVLGIRERLQPWGGTIEFSENEPRGTRATVRLPVES